MTSSSIFVLTVVLLAVAAGLIYAIAKVVRRLRSSSLSTSTETMVPDSSTELPVQHGIEPPLQDFEEEDDMSDIGRFVKRLRDRKALSERPTDILGPTVVEFGSTLDEEEVLEGAVNAGFTPEEMVPYLLQRGYTVAQVIAFAHGNFHDMLDGGPCFKLASSLMPGASVDEVARTVVSSVYKDLDDRGESEDFDWDDIVADLITCGCPPTSLVKILYDETDLNFAQSLSALPQEHSLVLAATAVVAAELDVDLADDEVYSQLREDDQFSFVEIATILRSGGTSAEDVIDLEVGFYDEASSDLGELLEDLTSAGFEPVKALSGLYDAENDLSTLDIIQAALDQDLSIEQIASFVIEEEISIDDLDEVLRGSEVDLEVLIELEYAVLSPERYKAGLTAQPTVAPEAEEPETASS